MREWAAALLAAGCAFIINRWGIKRFGFAEIIWLGPVIEEVGKTGSAVIMGASILPVHMFFGICEAMFDLWVGASRCHAAALASIIGHGLFGYLTIWGYAFFASWWKGLLPAIAAHIFWNSYVILFLLKKPRK